MAIEPIILFAKHYLAQEGSGHDFYHAQRVAAMAQKLYEQDQPAKQARAQQALTVILATAYLHDVIDEKVTTEGAERTIEIKQLLTAQGLDSAAQKNIFDTMTHMSFSKNLKHHFQLSTEGQYVQDADRIDGLGAIGIARTFTYGGHAGHPIYDPEIPPVTLTSHDQYRQHQTTSLNHFYEKLLTLQDTMNTNAGRAIAAKRTAYMQAFLTQFKAEWQGER